MLHVKDYLCLEDLPTSCIIDCARSGNVTKLVRHWRKKLNFTVDRDAAIRFLVGYGAWEREELASDTNEALAERVLWIACGDFKEWMLCKSENPDRDPPAGTDIVSFF